MSTWFQSIPLGLESIAYASKVNNNDIVHAQFFTVELVDRLWLFSFNRKSWRLKFDITNLDINNFDSCWSVSSAR